MTPSDRAAGMEGEHAVARSTLAAATVLGLSSAAIVVGFRIMDPREAGWVLRGDWHTHFLGWHFFRHEAWQWPPGRIVTLLEPVGTSLGYTDSIPLVAMLLKPFAPWLPNPFQYLGLWLVVCVGLQAFFGALVLSTWTPRRALQLFGALLFVLMPTLAARVAHPALFAHWLLLWALWLNWREPTSTRSDLLHHGAIGLTAGLVHPYLAVMVLGLLLALVGRRALAPGGVQVRTACVALAVGCGMVVTGWWCSGLFTLTSSVDLIAAPGAASMNLLSLVNPGALPSTFLRGFPAVSLLQLGEGYQYLGVGIMFLFVIALIVALVRYAAPDPSSRHWVVRRPWSRECLPLVFVLLVFTAYSVIPVIAVGQHVIIDLSNELSALLLFRSTGRFFWPTAYALLAAATGYVARALSARTATVAMAAAVALQLADMRPSLQNIQRGARDDAFFAVDTPFRSAQWHAMFPHYQRLRLYYPEYCRVDTFLPAAAAGFMAGLYGLSLNDGFAARLDAPQLLRSCEDLAHDFARGAPDDATIYMMPPQAAVRFQARLGELIECREIDAIGVCVTSESASTWRRTP